MAYLPFATLHEGCCRSQHTSVCASLNKVIAPYATIFDAADNIWYRYACLIHDIDVSLKRTIGKLLSTSCKHPLFSFCTISSVHQVNATGASLNQTSAWINNYMPRKVWNRITTLYNGYNHLFVPVLTHWGRVTHICVSKLTIIVSDNGLSPGRRQTIIWTNAGILLIGPLGTKFNETSIEIHTISFKKIHLKMSSGKWRPSCLGLNVLNLSQCSERDLWW